MKYIVEAIFYSYYYNRSIYHMIALCEEIEARIDLNYNGEQTDDGDIMYGILVILYGDFGTSPRSGWIYDENREYLIDCIDEIKNNYNKEVKENV